MRRTFLLFACLALACGPRNDVRADSPDPRLAGYRTPPGWKVTVAATEPLVVNPVTMTFGTDGRLFVVEWTPGGGPNDHIKVLTDTDGDGTFDKADMYMDHLELPAGVCFRDGWTYVTLNHDVVRFQDRDGDGKFETREVIATGFGNDDSHHRVSGMTIGPDGWLYLTTGDSDARARGSDGSTATVLRSGGVFRCKPDGSHLENFAFGMRNPWGNVAFDDEFHMFHTDNDNEGDPGFTGCRLLHVVEGGDYGWRLREGARCCTPDYERATWNGGRPGRLGWIAETGRGAPAGLCVLNSAAFPPSTRNLLVYPDVFRKLVRAYKLKPAGATYQVAEEVELLASNDPLFRPDDAEVGPDGALYVLDWRTDSGGAGQLSGNGKTGRIYRLTWGGTEQEPARTTLPLDRFTKLIKGEDGELVAALSDEDYGTRRTATLELMRRIRAAADGGPEGKTRLAELERRLNPFGLPGRPNDSKTSGRDPFSLTRSHAMAILTSPAPQHDLDLASYPSLMFGCQILDPPGRATACDYLGRFAGKWARQTALGLLMNKDEHSRRELLRVGKEGDPSVMRSVALALGSLKGLGRSRPGEDLNWARAFDEHQTRIKALGPPPPPRPEPTPPSEKEKQLAAEQARLESQITSDLIAEWLITLAIESMEADPFLRDGITRGLERLGDAGLAAVQRAIKSGGRSRVEAGLFALQGWRDRNGVNAILAEATSEKEWKPTDRANLFRTLRELVPAVPADRIAGWLERNPQADPEPRVEAVHVLTALFPSDPKAAGPVLPALLADPNGDVRRAGLELAGRVRNKGAEDALVQLVKAPDRPADERRLALSALRGYEDKALVPVLAGLFGTSRDAGFQAELLRVLASLDYPAAAEHASKLLASDDRELRQEAIGILGQRPESALEVARLYNAGKLPADDLPRVIEATRSHATPELQAALQTLLKNKLLAAPTGDEARRLRETVSQHGNPERGKRLYLDEKRVGCTVCHRMEGVGGSVGPDLTRVWETLSFEKRLESILEPSKEIKEGFGTFKVATKNGQVVTGLLLADTPEGVTLKDSQGREVRVPVQEIDEKGPDKTSLMPVGVVGNLSFNELADLLAFLGDRKAQESLRGAKK